MAFSKVASILQSLVDAVIGKEPKIQWTLDNPSTVGKKIVELLEAGSYQDLRNLLTRRIRWLLSTNKLETSWKSVLDSQGKVVSVGEGEVTKSGDVTIVRFPLVLEKIAIKVVVRISTSGHVTSIRAVPDHSNVPWSPPDYVDETLFEESEVTLGADDRDVPASLVLPHSSCAAIIMLQGSGAADRNSSVGQLKPFKDLAWGLASKGIASVRFDKAAFAHAERLSENITLEDEYIYHARAAIALLRSGSEVAGLPVFILGHSLGGCIAPRVGKEEPSIAGLVILAGLTEALQRSAIRQMKYINTLKDKTYHVSEAVLDAAAKQAELVESPTLSLSTPASKLPFAVPASYWLDIRNYNPVSTAAGLGKPMLIMQGGRDYQVTLKDDFEGWKKGLGGIVGVEFKVYDDMNHMFRKGKGMSSPDEYNVAGAHVDGDVVEYISRWITQLSLPPLDQHEMLRSLVYKLLGLSDARFDALDRATDMLSKLSSQAIIRALTATSMKLWAFQIDFPRFDIETSMILQSTRKCIRDLDRAVALRNVDLAAHSSLIGSEEFREKLIPQKALGLAIQLSNTLAPFFSNASPHRELPSDWVGFSTWGEDIEEWTARKAHFIDLFTKALIAKADSCLNSRDYELVSYLPGTPFDNTTMKAETIEGAPNSARNHEGRRVQLCIEAAPFAHPVREIARDASVAEAIVSTANFISRDQNEKRAFKPMVKAVVILFEDN
ncbi:hypothetical protein V501_08025 [Pseudogymnoascus sp. VKM F-4519 (FW-2642)]|nr:hypothetical protein V501_08025 [Pseudogymnoascus sp. VKM F-4519 (FW-2642)]